jgi:hypothetical protein
MMTMPDPPEPPDLLDLPDTPPPPEPELFNPVVGDDSVDET